MQILLLVVLFAAIVESCGGINACVAKFKNCPKKNDVCDCWASYGECLAKFDADCYDGEMLLAACEKECDLCEFAPAEEISQSAPLQPPVEEPSPKKQPKVERPKIPKKIIPKKVLEKWHSLSDWQIKLIAGAAAVIVVVIIFGCCTTTVVTGAAIHHKRKKTH